MKYLNEMFVALALVMGLSVLAQADTVINYDDGSTYTVSEGEQVYVSGQKLFKKKQWSNGGVNFSLAKPNVSRDFVPSETDGMQLGSHEWCLAYEPWSEGLTFDMITWQRACDTNNDGKYGCGDDSFDASGDAGVCSA